MNWRSLPTSHRVSLGVLLRLALAAGVVMPLATLYREALAEAWLPAYRAVFAWVADEFRLLSLAIDHEGADRVLRATVAWKRIVVLGGHVIYPDPRGTANASTLIAHALQGPMTAVIAAFAWPARRIREFAWRVLLLGPLLTVLVLSDLPCVLAAELWELPLDALAPGTVSVLVIWKDFLQGGGRHALGLAAAVAAVHGAGWLGASRNPLLPATAKGTNGALH
jgi:hypothetical protein